MTSTSARALSESLHKLQVGDTKAAKDTAVAESWEDEAEDEVNASSQVASPAVEIPATPPTSPISPSVRTKATSIESPYQTFPPFGMDTAEPESRAGQPPRGPRTNEPDKRPEKTTSAAARLIAAGIGQRPARRTQEEREYDQAMKVQEKKRRDAVKEEAARAEREKEKAKQAIWAD